MFKFRKVKVPNIVYTAISIKDAMSIAFRSPGAHRFANLINFPNEFV